MPVEPSTHELQLERLGLLWRSQGEEFLAEQAAEVIADVDRLRATYLAQARVSTVPKARAKAKADPKPKPARTVDLREGEVSGMTCRRHATRMAADRCGRCRDPFCEECIVRPDPTRGTPLCGGCALVLGGVRHRRARWAGGSSRARALLK